MADASLTPHQQSLINALLADAPADFVGRHAHFLKVKQALLEIMGSVLQTSLNEHFTRLPQSTLAERRELAAELNRCLKSLSLAIRCPRTDKPAILVVDTADREHSDISRFRLQITDDHGRQQRPVTWSELPASLELMPAPIRIEPLSRERRPPTNPRGDR